jgi:hypothetical protein
MPTSDFRFNAEPRPDEIRDLSPAGLRFVLTILIGVGILAIAGIL